MRPARSLLLALALIAVPAARVRAEPCSPAFDALAAEVDLRAYLVLYPSTPEQKAEKRTLGRVRRLLHRWSPGYRRDVATAAAAGRALLDLYPSSTPVEDLVRGTLDGLRQDIGRERDDLVLTAGQLPAGTLRDAALAGAGAADAALAEDDAAGPLDVDARTAALGAAALALEKGFRRALPGRDGRRRRTCGDEMWVEQGGELLWRADFVTAVYQEASDHFLLSGRRARHPADESELDLEVRNVFGAGTWTIDFGTGIWRDTFTQYGIVESGTLTITAMDKAKGTAEGTFTFTARGCLFDCATYQVTGGRFRLRNLRVL